MILIVLHFIIYSTILLFQKVFVSSHFIFDITVGGDDQVEGPVGDKLGTVIKKTIRNTIWQGSGAFQLQMPLYDIVFLLFLSL